MQLVYTKKMIVTLGQYPTFMLLGQSVGIDFNRRSFSVHIHTGLVETRWWIVFGK